MFGTRSFLKNSLATESSAVSWTTSHQNIEAQNQRNSTYNSSSLRTTNTASSDKPSNTVNKLINSVCSVVSTNKAQIVDDNGFLIYVDPYHGIVMQYPSPIIRNSRLL